MDEEVAWEKITTLTNKVDLSLSDRDQIRVLMRWLSEEQRAWLEEGLFLSDVIQPTEEREGDEYGQDN